MLTGTPWSRASLPWPDTWSACVCVSSTRTMPHLAVRRLGEQRLDRVGRIHDDRLARALAADQIGGAAEVVVEELMEKHGDDGTIAGRYRS